MHVLVSGGTGFVGTRLVNHLLGAGHKVTVASRSPARVADQFGGRAAGCDYDNLPAAFDGVINLAGASLDKRWTQARKRAIRDSRVETTRQLVRAAEERGAGAFVSTSAVGYYGNRGDDELPESAGPGDTFLAKVGEEWEAAAHSDKLRVSIVRLGIVLHHSGGALKVMLPLFRMLLGGRLGNGRQWWPWVHLDDAVALFAFMLADQRSGVVNGTAPTPVTNREFTRELARAVRRPVSLPVPAFALKLLYGEMADMLLHSQRVIPKRTAELGFSFRFPELASALEDAIGG
jgi:uncharacterized protein